jgi:hypothetical protein
MHWVDRRKGDSGLNKKKRKQRAPNIPIRRVGLKISW